MDSYYDDAEFIVSRVLMGRHREVIGGNWDVLGTLQHDFLLASGLKPHHRLLDIGCGALRAGVKLIPYLEPGRYWGVDKNEALLRVGYDLELRRVSMTQRQPREQIVCLPDFEFDRLSTAFDFAIAQSLFTHFSLNRIRRCLARLSPWMEPDGRLYFTFFEVGQGEDREHEKLHGDGLTVSHSDRSFYHYSLGDLRYAAEGLPIRLEEIGEWGHPRGQRMALLRWT